VTERAGLEINEVITGVSLSTGTLLPTQRKFFLYETPKRRTMDKKENGGQN
jgi:hypothetical protein